MQVKLFYLEYSRGGGGGAPHESGLLSVKEKTRY